MGASPGPHFALVLFNLPPISCLLKRQIYGADISLCERDVDQKSIAPTFREKGSPSNEKIFHMKFPK